MERENRLSRRKFLETTGLVVVGAAAGSLLVSCGTAPVAEENEGEPAPTAVPSATLPSWPWPYQKLDVQLAQQRGYEGYYEGACCYGAASAIIKGLSDTMGEPYTNFPVDMFRYGEGGVVGWSSLCGALNGAAAVINLVSDEETYTKIINELMGWYTQFAFPAYLPVEPKVAGELVTSISGSPLCHVSVTNWCKASGFGAKSSERSERCGRLTADVAGKAAELLNQALTGEITTTYVAPESITGCMSCHGAEAMNNTRGKMDCVQCHEPHN